MLQARVSDQDDGKGFDRIGEVGRMKKGDLVHCKAVPKLYGEVMRVSKKGQWADVDWFTHSKRLGLKYLELHDLEMI